MQTIIDLKAYKKLAQKLRRNWKTVNKKNFINMLKERILKLLLNQKTKR